jgi:hypothetical protein
MAPFLLDQSGASANGGSFDVDPDGSFTYVPPPNFTGTDSFTYQVSDGADATMGTVNVTVTNVVWYVRDVVDANNAAGGDGRSTNAFETLADAQTASGNGHYIYVFEGNTATTPLVGGIALKDGQKLWGQGIDLDLPGFPDVVTATNKPRLRTTTASTDVVTVPATAGNRQNVEIRGLDLEATGATSNAIDATSSGANQLGLTISDITVRGATAEGVDVNHGSTGAATLAFSDNDLTATGTAADVERSSTGLLFITAFHDNVVQGTSAGPGLAVRGTGGVVTFDASAAAGIQAVPGGTTHIGAPGDRIGGAGLNLSNVTGALDFANPAAPPIAAGDLDVYTDSGAALIATGSGGFDLDVTPNAGVLVANAGPAVVLSALDANLQLNSLTSSGGSTGVNIANITGTFSAPSGSSIADTSGTDFLVTGGTATITYGGTITDDLGNLVLLTSTGGNATFTGAITDGDDGDGGSVVDGGVRLNGNTGTIRFSGGLVLSTGTNNGFTATGGGTVDVCDENPCAPAATGALINKITTTTGTALNVANTTIGANNLEFRSISAGTGASGPTNGIVLNTTGASGRLIVTGSGASGLGGNGSGGLIQNTSGDGISLISTTSPSFSNMTIQTTGGSGIAGTMVAGFTFDNGTITGSGNAVEESNIAFRDNAGTSTHVTGTVTVTDSVLNTAFDSGVDIRQGFGTNCTIDNLTVTGNTFTSTTSTATSKGSGIKVDLGGSATTVGNLTKATISGNTITNFPSGAGVKVLGGNGNAGGSAHPATIGDPASGANVVTITGNFISGASSANRMGTNAIETLVSGWGQGHIDIDANGTVASPLTNFAGVGAALSAFGNATVKGTITNNRIVANNAVNSSGIAGGADFTFSSADTPSLTLTISGNNVSAMQGNGILTGAKNCNATTVIKVLNNTVGTPTAGARPGIRVDSGTNLGGNTSVCLEISGNTSSGSSGVQGIGLRRESTCAGCAFNIEGNPATGSPGVETYVDSQNPSGGGTLLLSATTGFGNCTAP